MRLALRVGRVDVDQMLCEMSAEQLEEWRIALDVLGLDDQWRQAATVAATTYNTLCQLAASIGGSRRKPPVAPVEDFMPLVRPKGRRDG